jgi:hypothetical protein
VRQILAGDALRRGRHRRAHRRGGDGTKLFRDARQFIEDAASYGTTELLESVPLANLGQPNDWLVRDARRAEGQFVVWLNADDLPLPSLAEALARQLRILGEVLGSYH